MEEALGPFVATIQKAIDGADRRLLTRIGLSQALAENAGGVWQIATAQVAFATGTPSFNHCGGGAGFAPAAVTQSPPHVVHEPGEDALVPAHLPTGLLPGALTT